MCLLIQSVTSALGQTINNGDELLWRDARDLTVDGKGWTDTQSFYDRLPARAESLVRPAVWGLSHDSAGLCVRFVTDATNINARWTLRSASLAMPHMPASGVSGLDLYVKDKGKWHWVGGGRPAKSPTEERVLVKGLAQKEREFALYLPLYNGVRDVKIGIAGGKVLLPAPAWPARLKPIVFYGTSITQGGCASRPGMAYPAILGRRLDRLTINLGFSGNALSEPEVAHLLAELDAAVYVLDPLPNMTAESVAARIEPLVTTLRQAHPEVPIVLVENEQYAADEFVAVAHAAVQAKNVKLRDIYRRLRKAGQRRLFYVPAAKLVGSDGEATVDGVHPTDLGFMRMADTLTPVLRRALKASW
jgi:GDSL-like Lipase/Acylhydrolase family/N-terminus of Esterase_SGNH_hydro-type